MWRSLVLVWQRLDRQRHPRPRLARRRAERPARTARRAPEALSDLQPHPEPRSGASRGGGRELSTGDRWANPPRPADLLATFPEDCPELFYEQSEDGWIEFCCIEVPP